MDAKDAEITALREKLAEMKDLAALYKEEANRLRMKLRALEETFCLMDDPRRMTMLYGDIRPISTEKIGEVMRQLEKAEGDARVMADAVVRLVAANPHGNVLNNAAPAVERWRTKT